MTPSRATSFDAIVSLGSNIGDKAGNIARAIRLLTGDGAVTLVARSRDYRTPPWGKIDQDWFVNACVALKTDVSPEALLRRCQAVENDMKRVRQEHWGPRVIDLDVIWFRGVTVDDPHLTIPHPRALDRAFVLVPLAEIAPDLEIAGRSVAGHLARIERTGVEPFE